MTFQQTARAVPSLGNALRPARFGLFMAGLFSLGINLLMLVSPIYMLQVFDRVITTGALDTLVWLTVLAGAALAVYGALEAVRSTVLGRIGAWAERRLRGPAIRAALGAALAGGRLGAQPLRDLSQVRGFLAGPAMAPLFDAPWTPLFVAVLWIMHPAFGALALGSMLVLVAVAGMTEALTRRSGEAGAERQAASAADIEAVLRNADTVHAMGMLDSVLRRFGAEHDAGLSLQQRAADRAAALQGLAKFIRMFVQVGILGLGAWLVLRGESTAGAMIAASILLGRALAPVDQAIACWRQFVAFRGAWGRINRSLAAPAPAEGGMELPEPQGLLQVEDLSYAVGGADRPLLHNVSMAAPAGSVIGVIGPSASGKSTLCRLLVGALEPTAGHVRLDHADVTRWPRAAFGRHVGYLPQDIELFAGTVRENIARLDAGDHAAVVAAAQAAGVHEMILRLPQGYETTLGPGGTRLSGGQRQRIGLARALYGAPRLVVLDEPNAALDPDGDAALARAIGEARGRGATLVVVSHRPSLLQGADYLLVLRDGEVEAFAPAGQVLPLVTGARPGQTARSSR